MNAIERSAASVSGISALAALLGVTPSAIHQWATGTRPVPPDRCPAIERATSGQVTCAELRPDVAWHRVPDPTWPNPEGRPLIDVAAPVRQAVLRDAA